MSYAYSARSEHPAHGPVGQVGGLHLSLRARGSLFERWRILRGGHLPNFKTQIPSVLRGNLSPRWLRLEIWSKFPTAEIWKFAKMVKNGPVSMFTPPPPTLVIETFYAIPSRGMALKRSCPKRCPIEFSAGINFIPAEIFLKIGFTVVSWGKWSRKRRDDPKKCLLLLYRDIRKCHKAKKWSLLLYRDARK